jgi:hypothetical protein
LLSQEVKDSDPGVARQLEALGVSIGMSDWERCMGALQAYRRVKGNLKVRQRPAREE